MHLSPNPQTTIVRYNRHR